MMIFTALNMLETSAQRFPDKIALKDEVREITFKELENKSRQLGRHLTALGVNKGDRVGIFKENSVNTIISIFGAMYAGGAFVCINTKIKPRQVNHIIEDSGIKLIISNHHKINYFFSNIRNEDVNLMDIEQILTDNTDYNDVLIPHVIDRDLASLVYTSGSTGKPKGVMFTHNEVVMCAKVMSGLFKNTSDENILCTLPFSADYGLTLLYTMLLVGGKLTILNSFFPNDIVNTLVSERITSYSGITPIWPLLYGSRSLFPEKEFPCLRYISIGGGYPPKSIMKQIIEKFEGKTEIYMLYGLTEASWSTCLRPGMLKEKYGSIGTPVPNVEISLINDDGKICTSGEEGVLVHRGGVVAKGYWNDLVKSSEVFKQSSAIPEFLRDKERVVYSGDKVIRDEDGFYFYKSRVDEQIKVMGYRICTEDLLDCLYDTNLVELCCVFGVPAEEGDQKIVACIVPRENVVNLKEQLFQYLKKELASYMVPTQIFILSELPLTPSNKIDVVLLKNLFDENKLADNY